MKTERNQRNLVSQPQDEALATSILQALPEADREAIIQFYHDRKKPEDIERDLGLKTGHVNRLKASVKARFFAERHQGTAA